MVNINLIRDIANMIESYPKYEKQFISILQEVLDNDDFNRLTNTEVDTGEREGNIACIKMYKNRTGCGLVDAKNFVENYFKENNLEFFGRKYQQCTGVHLTESQGVSPPAILSCLFGTPFAHTQICDKILFLS